MTSKPKRLAILQSHPIQYFAPLFRRLAQDEDLDITVFYCSRHGIEEYYDPEFGQKLVWDIPLLEGYKHKFLPNSAKVEDIHSGTGLYNPSILAELKKGEFDAVWVHGHRYLTNQLVIGGAKLLKLPVFMRCESHLLLQRSQLKLALRRPLLSLMYRKFCHSCLPIGTRNREFYQFHGVRSHRLFLVPYSVDNNFFINNIQNLQSQIEDLKSEMGLPTDKPILLFASKLTERKHPFDLLVAFEQIRKSDDEAALAFVGSGEEEERLRAYVQEHNIPDVYFLGFANQSKLPSVYAIADVFILPSENEPWALVINEAMCAGLPIIASEEIGAVKDLVRSGVNGYTFTAGDTAALANHLRTLIRNPQLREEMGQQSLEIIRNWDFEACVQGVKAAMANL